MWPGYSGNRKSSEPRNEGSASGGPFELAKGRDNAELLHHAQGIPIAVGVHDFSVGDVVNCNSVNGYFLIRRWNSHIVASVGAGKRPAGNHFILLRNGVLDGEVQIRVTCKEVQDLSFFRFRPIRVTATPGTMHTMPARSQSVPEF